MYEEKYKKWFWMVVVLISPVGTFWLVFYSVFTANLPYIIPLRDWYQNTYWKAERVITSNTRDTYPYLDPVYTVMPQKSLFDNTNVYLLRGEFINIDSKEFTIEVLGHDRKTYFFKVGDNLFTKNNTQITSSSDYAPKMEVINLNSHLIPYSTRLGIMWDDKRTLYEIINQYGDNPQRPLNEKSTLFFSLTNFNL